MKIYIGADHQGFNLKQEIITFLQNGGYDVEDVGDKQLNPDDDYPQFAQKAAMAILGSHDRDAKGILICGSGQGMCMAANRFKGIRAALGYDRDAAVAAKNDDDANVLCLPAKSLTIDRVQEIINAWLNTPFGAAARYIRRIKEIDEF